MSILRCKTLYKSTGLSKCGIIIVKSPMTLKELSLKNILVDRVLEFKINLLLLKVDLERPLFIEFEKEDYVENPWVGIDCGSKPTSSLVKVLGDLARTSLILLIVRKIVDSSSSFHLSQFVPLRVLGFIRKGYFVTPPLVTVTEGCWNFP